MSTYGLDEESVEDSHPIEFADIEIGSPATSTYRITSGERPLVLAAHPVDGTRRLYDAVSTEHSKIAVSGVGAARELTFTLPIDHPLVGLWLPMPADAVYYTLWRMQERSGEVQQLWTGRIQSMNANGAIATFRVPSRTVESLLRVIPSTTSGRTCPHVLYDAGTCRISRAGLGPTSLAHTITATVISVSGDRVRVDLANAGRAGNWATNGELVHVATQSRRTVRKQVDVVGGTQANLYLQAYIPPLKAGDSVQISAGCSKLISNCVARFDNRHNFGGAPRMPHGNLLKLGNKKFVTGEM